jgi:hypothetical protein
LELADMLSGGVEKNDSVMTLSSAAPTNPIDPSKLALRIRAVPVCQ